MSEQQFAALGSKATAFEGFETFERPPFVTEITFDSEDITASCPVTGQPDFYALHIMYEPALLCVETKTLKLYLQSFRDKGMFVEQLASSICVDLATALQSHFMSVELTQKVRGGIVTRASAYVYARDLQKDGDA